MESIVPPRNRSGSFPEQIRRLSDTSEPLPVTIRTSGCPGSGSYPEGIRKGSGRPAIRKPDFIRHSSGKDPEFRIRKGSGCNTHTHIRTHTSNVVRFCFNVVVVGLLLRLCVCCSCRIPSDSRFYFCFVFFSF